MNMDTMLDFKVAKVKSDVNLLKSKLMDEFIEHWYSDLNRLHAKKGRGGNKLRTYGTFRFMYWRGKDLKCNVINFRDRTALAKIRCRASSLLVETGRYSIGQYIPAEGRICTICNEV